MLGEKKIKALCEHALSKAKGCDIEVVVSGYESHLTRFANSIIHQNVSEVNTQITVRIIKGKKIGVVTSNDLSKRGIERAVSDAKEIAENTPEDPDFAGLPEGSKKYKEIPSFYRRTALFSPLKRAQAVDIIVKIAKDYELHAFGSVTNGVTEIAVFNSKGVFAYFAGTDAFVNVTMQNGAGSGYAETASRDIKEIDFESVAKKAAEKAMLSQNIKDLEPGKYTVLLEPLAVRDFIEYLAWLGFGAKSYIEKTSFMYGKIGKKITGDNISIIDDPYNPLGFAFPFDFEGVPRKKVTLIQKGVAKAIVTDSKTAKKLKRKNTGHSLGGNISNPIPLHLHLLKGKDSFEKMLASMDKGLLVTRFHYINVIDPRKTVITGMTRDGLFWIEKGEVAYAVKNLRFTESIIEALKKVKIVEQRVTLVGGGAGYGGRFPVGSLVPSLIIEEFTFTGKTEF